MPKPNNVYPPEIYDRWDGLRMSVQSICDGNVVFVDENTGIQHTMKYYPSEWKHLRISPIINRLMRLRKERENR